MSYEKTPGVATESPETSGDLENPGSDTLEQFAGLGTSENYDQHGPPGSQPETSDANERFQLQVQLATELEHDAHRQATTHQSNESLIKKDTWAGATNSSISNAKSAREAGDAERADSYLMAGLIIDWKYRGRCDGFVQQAVINDSAGELLGAVKDNSELVLKDPDSDYAHTINLELSNKLNLLELVVDHRIEAEEHSLELQQALTGEDRRDRITKLYYEDLIVLGRSPEVNRRDPELQKLAIKTAISELQSSPWQYSYSKDSPSADIGELAKARPDIFQNELDDEFRGLRQQRLADYGDRRVRRPFRRRFNPGLIESTLDTVVVDLWANGNSDIAAKMLTASSYEIGRIERAAREPKISQSWNNPARVEEVISEISEYIHQRQAALHNTVSQYTAELDHFLASSQSGPDSDTLSRSLKSVFEPDNIDNAVDPEGYVELVTNAIPELITGLDTDQVGEVCEGLRSVMGPDKLRLAEAIQDPQTISSLADETFGLEMRRLAREDPKRLKEIATIIEDKRFKDIVEDCQLAQPDRIIGNSTLWSRGLRYGENLPDIDSIAIAFSDETNLVQALSQIPESIKLDLFSHVVRHPDQAIGLATTLTDDGVTELLARDDQLQSDIVRAVLQWEPEAAPQKSRELLEALELIGEMPSTIGNDWIKRITQEHILDSSEDYLKTATELAEVLTNIEIAGQLVQNDRLQSDVARDVLRGEPELILQKSRELLEALELIGGMPSTIGNDEIERMLQERILANPDDYLKTATELAEVLTNIELAGLTLVALRLGSLPKDFSPDKLVEVIDKHIEIGGIWDVVGGVVSLSPSERDVAMAAVAKLAPPRLIDIYCRSNMMPPTVEGISQLTSCMELDERTSLAPAYFSEIVRRLPRAEGKPSFAIVFQEAMDTYSQIDYILAVGDEAKAMLGRIQATLGRRGPGADRDSIALANAVIRQGRDPAEIETALEAKAYPLHCLNRDLGLELDVSESGLDQLTEKMGDLMPSMVYAASADQPVRSRLAEIITSLASDSYHHHKYPACQPLIEAGILPPIDEAAYQRWQTTESTDSAEVVANTAVDVSDKIRQVVSSALSSYQQLEGFNHLEDPEAKIEAIGAVLAQIGQQIGATHRQKQHGEISPEQAETAVAALQAQKQQLELARDAVRLAGVTGPEVASGKLHNEDGRPTQATISQTLDKLAAVDLGQSSETLSQLREMLDNYAAAATTDIGRIVVSDVDDFQTTFEIGANPVGSCQHYKTGGFNRGLLGYFEPGVKIITARNDSGGLIARAILRLAFDPDGSPAMVLEPTYAAQASNDIEDAVKDHAVAKAASMGLVLYNSRSRSADMTLPRLIAPYGYSDGFGGLYGSGRQPETQLILA